MLYFSKIWMYLPYIVGKIMIFHSILIRMLIIVRFYGVDVRRGILFDGVAEWISYFCLARNLIRPLGSTHNFPQSGWLILFIPDHLSEQHKLGKSRQTLLLFSQNFLVQDRRLTVCSSIAAAAAATKWGKPSNLWTPCVYFS